MPAYAYILASKPYGTLYVGSTGDIARRVWEHRNGEGSIFCSKYKVFTHVYFEQFDFTRNAIQAFVDTNEPPKERRVAHEALKDALRDDLGVSILLPKAEYYRASSRGCRMSCWPEFLAP